MNCDICKKHFTGIECLQQHEASDKHKKKLLLYNSSMHTKSEGVSVSTSYISYPCTTCAISFQTLSEFIEHTGSKDHVTASTPKINPTTFPCTSCGVTLQSLSEFIEHTGSKNHASASTPEVPNVNSSTFPCTTCVLTFQTLSEFIEHTGSRDHALMILRENNAELSIGDCDSTSNLQSEKDLLLNNSKAVISWHPRCEKCDKNFSGPEPYQAHIISFAHKKKCGLLPTVEMPAEIPFTTYCSLSCEACHVTFTGPVPYQDHMRSIRHKRKVLASTCNLSENSKDKLAESELPTLSEAASKKYCLNEPTGKENDSDYVTMDSDMEQSKKTNCLVPTLAWYCEICDVKCSGIDPYQAHLKSKKHGKKMVRKEADSKQNELQSLLSGQTSFASSIQHSGQITSRTEVDGRNRSEHATTGDLGKEVKKSLYGEDWDVKTCTPSTLDLTFFAVGEKIDFNKNSKTKIEVTDLDSVDVEEEETEDMDE